MIANYHTHTYRCNHAVGNEREYIEYAIQNGMQVLGFADHCPMPFPGDYYSGHRMKLHETAGYFETLRALKEEYKEKIRILIGFEVEYYPDLFDDFLKFVEPYQPDYFILGQHALFNEQGAPVPGVPTTDPALLHQYVKQVTEGLATGQFLYPAHPDMMNFVGDAGVYEKEMTSFCEFCKSREIPLEINMLGLMEKRHYPRAAFWEIAAKVGNIAIFGCDAHRPEVLNQKEVHQLAVDWAERFGLPVITELPL